MTNGKDFLHLRRSFAALGGSNFSGTGPAASSPIRNPTPDIAEYRTDCHYFMELGITCYGFAPFRMSDLERQRLHGNDERLSSENLRSGTRFLYELLLEIGSSDGGRGPVIR